MQPGPDFGTVGTAGFEGIYEIVHRQLSFVDTNVVDATSE